MTAITRVHAREVLDSRGRPTVEVEMSAGDVTARAIVPSGASTGKAEAVELRDGDPNRYDGRGVLTAVRNVNEVLGPAVMEMDPREQRAVDDALLALDGTLNKSRLGANAILGISMAAARLAAAMKGVPLWKHFGSLFRSLWPTEGPDEDDENCFVQPLVDDRQPKLPTWSPLPMVNMISGGLHAGGNLDFQDILVMPVGAPDFPTALEWVVSIYNRLGEVLTAAGYEGRLVGDEGGFGPRLRSNREAFELLVRAIERAKLRPGEDVQLALDAASTHFFDGTYYQLKATGEQRLTAAELIEQYESLVRDFPLTSIEDGLAEEDWAGWQELTRRLGDRLQLIGDDLFATQSACILRGMAGGVANAALIKLNQVGSVSETLDALKAARDPFRAVVSARSGETEDDTIADLSLLAGQIKIGSIVRSERLAKYNRLLRIHEELTGTNQNK